MTRIASSFALAIAALALPLPATAGSLTRTFVSGAGNDSNPCTVTAPCRTFAAAYAATAANGIIAALDPAGYGPLTITQAITIDGNGWAAITAPSGMSFSGITINVGASDSVVLRGLTLDGQGLAQTFGIRVVSVGSLTLDGCAVRGMTSLGLALGAATATQLAISNSSFTNNKFAISLQTFSSGTLTASIDRTQFNGNFEGLQVDGKIGTAPFTVAVTDSVAANNGTGFQVSSAASQSVTTLTLINTQVAGNSSIGIQASGTNATLWLGNSTVVGNASGFSADTGGVINSFGDNYFADNGGNTGSLTPVTPQ